MQTKCKEVLIAAFLHEEPSRIYTKQTRSSNARLTKDQKRKIRFDRFSCKASLRVQNTNSFPALKGFFEITLLKNIITR